MHGLLVSPEGSVSVSPSVSNGLSGLDYNSKCTASGGLNNEFTWTYIRNNDRKSNTFGLNIFSARAHDGGDYECLVSNPAGNESDIFTLNSE